MDRRAPPFTLTAAVVQPEWIRLPQTSVLLHEVRRDDRVWVRLRHVSPRDGAPPPDEGEVDVVFDRVEGLCIRVDRYPAFVAELQRIATELTGFASEPDFAALAARYRHVENHSAPSQRNVTLARLFGALAAEGDANDSEFLRELDRVVARHHPKLDATGWGEGAPSRAGRGVEASAKTRLMDQFHQLCALDPAALDALVAEHLAGRSVDASSPHPPVDAAYALAAQILGAIHDVMPHLDPAVTARGETVGRLDTLAMLPARDDEGRPAKLVVRRVPDGVARWRGPAAPEAVEALAMYLRQRHAARCAEDGPDAAHALLRPDDAEPVLRKALRIAGLEASKVEGFFKFLDRRSTRNGTAEPTKNRDQRRREKKSARRR
jgi:hypothetical protein